MSETRVQFPIPGNDCGYIILLNARYVLWPIRRYAKRRSKPDTPRFLYRIRERRRAETSVCLLCGKPTREHVAGMKCVPESESPDIPTQF